MLLGKPEYVRIEEVCWGRKRSSGPLVGSPPFCWQLVTREFDDSKKFRKLWKEKRFLFDYFSKKMTQYFILSKYFNELSKTGQFLANIMLKSMFGASLPSHKPQARNTSRGLWEPTLKTSSSKNQDLGKMGYIFFSSKPKCICWWLVKNEVYASF